MPSQIAVLRARSGLDLIPMQHRSYPLPPLMLGQVIEQAIIDHEHTHTMSCTGARR